MNTQDFKRKLTAVFSADVAGYSRLMGEDEAATVKTLEAYKQVMFSLIKQHRGRVIDSPGDNILAEFASVVDAVQCGVAVQKELQARNAELPGNRKMQFRIGINLGDVIEEGERIYGDGVNIAARLEALADPGGICVSKTAFDHIEAKLPLGYHFIGEQTVKNIAKPVGAYKVLMEPRVTGAEIETKAQSVPVWRRKSVLAGAVAVLVVVIGIAVWNSYFRVSEIAPASKDKMALPLPDQPSIAVLPFKNLSGEQEQEFLVDGITESIIGAISRVSGLFVIASNSVFTYKGKPAKVQTVSEELGVRNVLEGTVQRAGNRIRINAQLIDATTGRHLWSEKYDREMKDLFSVQDDISKEILTALRVKLAEGEQERVWARGTNNLEAYLKFLKAYDTFKSFSKQKMILTRQICEEAIALDPNYEQAYSLIGVAHLIDVWFSWGESVRSSIEKSEAALRKAVSLNPQSDFAYANLNHLYLVQERHDEAVAAGEKSVALNPNGDYNMVLLGITFNYVRRYEEAITLFKEARRRNPYCPAWYVHNMGNSYRGLGRWDEAIAEYKRALDLKPDHFPALTTMASVYGMAGRIEEGRAVAAEILRINPGFCTEKLSLPFKYKPDGEAVKEGLHRVGIPETPPLPLPDKPSIAVLPFVNMSGDPEQEYFSDGITEDIITNLSKVSGIFVISRNSSFLYKDKQVKIQEVAKDLGVHYVLEGSVRRGGNRVRITAQLIDGKTEYHVWADNYDRELRDIFSVQDEVTQKVVSELAVTLKASEYERLSRKHTENFEAYDTYLRGLREYWILKKENHFKGMELCRQAIEHDPHFPGGYALLSFFLSRGVRFGYSTSPREDIEKAFELAQKAISVDDTYGVSYSALASAYLMKGQHDDAVGAAMAAARIQPGHCMTLMHLGFYLHWAGRGEEAIKVIKEAQQLNPKYLYGRNPAFLDWLGYATFTAGRYQESVAAWEKAIDRFGPFVGRQAFLTASYSLLGRDEEARAMAQRLLKTNPNFTLNSWKFARMYKNLNDTERLLDALRKAGLK